LHIELTPRRKNVISGLIALVLMFSAASLGVQASFGAFADTYPLKASFDAAGQGLSKGSDVKIRGVNIGKVATVKLVDDRALVIMDIDAANQIPLSTTAVVRAKTLFGEKFVDLAPGAGEASGPFYSHKGETLDKCDTANQPEHSCTTGGFEIEQVLADAYPILQKIQPAELMTVIHSLAEAGAGLGPNINRTLVNSQKILDVNAAHDADTRQFLVDLAKLADQLGVRADDLVQTATDLNVALPTLNGRADELNTLLVQTARLSDDVADLLRNNKAFIDKSFAGGQATLDLLFDDQNDIIPLVVGLREYVQSLTNVTHIPAGDGTLMAAVKGITAGQTCMFLPCPGTGAAAAAAGPNAAALPGAIAGPAGSGPSAGANTGASPAPPSTVKQLMDYLAKLGTS
jgi:phospholipid/cholesterol/gamma-HCH transport system substrate-binding protein